MSLVVEKFGVPRILQLLSFIVYLLPIEDSWIINISLQEMLLGPILLLTTGVVYLILVVIVVKVVVVMHESALVSHVRLMVIVEVEEALTILRVAMHIKRLILVASGMLWHGMAENLGSDPLIMLIKVRLVEVGREVTEVVIVDVWIVHGLRLKNFLRVRCLNLIVTVRQIFPMTRVMRA